MGPPYTSSQIGAARGVLASHDALTLVNATEPELDDEGMPHDGATWLIWYERVYLPAARRHRLAIAELEAELGEHVPNHPYNFRPLCAGIVRYGGGDA